MWLWGEIKEQQNKMTVSLTALIIGCHMLANNKYGERQSQHYPSISQSGSLSSSPMRARLHLIKSFNLDHLGSAALFTTLHLGNATTCSSSSSRAEHQFTPLKSREDSRGGKDIQHPRHPAHRPRWTGRSYFAQSGTARFGFCFSRCPASFTPARLR